MRRLFGTTFLIFFVGLTTSPATLVDWSMLTWTPGTLSNSYDVEPTNPGNDVTFTITGNTADLQPSTTGPQTPAITGALQGGFSPAHVNLELALLPADNANSVTITINFSNMYPAGVAYVNFKLFDIDFQDQGGNQGYQDQIRSISATSTTGTSIAPTISGVGPNVSHTGTGLTQVLTGQVSTADSGASSSDANATITFNATNISSITFVYGDTNALNKTAYQHIGIDNLYFEVVPEVNPAAVTFTVCSLVVLGSTLNQRARVRRAGKRVS